MNRRKGRCAHAQRVGMYATTVGAATRAATMRISRVMVMTLMMMGSTKQEQVNDWKERQVCSYTES